MGFFGSWGQSFTANSVDELMEILSAIDVAVPERTRGRTSADRERYCIVKYLSYLSECNLVDFPVSVASNQPDHKSPDFFMESPKDGKVGIEHTDAAPESYQKAEAIAERDPNVMSLELSYYAKYPNIREIEDLKKGFICSGKKPKGGRGRGWGIGEVEDQWAEFVASAVAAKQQKVSSGNYDRCDAYELLV